MIFEKYKPLILGLWALFSFSVYSGNKQTDILKMKIKSK